MDNSSFPIAIKSPHVMDDHGIKLCLDEAKTMIEIDSYHDHIVNLQGVTYSLDSLSDKFTDVSTIL